jgi:hypothetical protein
MGSSKTLDSMLGTNTNDGNAAAAKAKAEQDAARKATAAKAEEERILAEREAFNAPKSLADLQQLDQTQIPGIVASQAPVEPSMWDKIRHGATSAREAVTNPDVKSTYGKVLGKLGSEQGLSTIAGLGAGVLGMNMNKQGTEAATGAYDQSNKLIQEATAADKAAYGGVNDSQEQLAMRQQAMKGLSDRASMGLTPEDEAALAGINRQGAQQFKANNATIGQDMARRGMANSGLGMAQSMGAADLALQNQALAGQNQAAQSFAAKQGALTNLAGQSNTALNADYARQMGKAQNLSAVNQFNAQQQASNLQGKGKTVQAAQGQKAQGVTDLVKGAVNTLTPNKNKPQV